MENLDSKSKSKNKFITVLLVNIKRLLKSHLFAITSLSLHLLLLVLNLFLLKIDIFHSHTKMSSYHNHFASNESKEKIRLMSKEDFKKLKQIAEAHNEKQSDPELLLKKANFLSDQSRRVLQETVSANVAPLEKAKGESKNTKKNTKQMIAKSKSNQATRRNKINHTSNTKESSEISLKPISLNSISLDIAQLAFYDVVEKNTPNEEINKNNQNNQNEKINPKANEQKQDVSEQNDSNAQEALAKGDGTGLKNSSNDYLPQLAKSDFTRLNTDEYKFFGFYQRLKKQLEQHWSLLLKEKAKNIGRSGRKIASSEDFITSLAVEVDASGKIRSLKITSSSGVLELDQAAVESFNRAGPFPNPPREMLLEGNGVAKIKWGFVVKS